MGIDFKVKNRYIGENYPPYYIADIGANHEGSLDRAFKLIELAKEAGADAAKFQNFTASKIVSKKGFEQIGTQSHQSSWKKTVYEVYEDASIEKNWTKLLKDKCDEVGINYFTSPYDLDSVDLVDQYGDLYKIGSGDITWLEIIEYIASKNKPVLIATGASTIADVERAMKTLETYKVPVCLMQCNTNYTLDPEKYRYVNLRVLELYKNKYPEVILGLSDHTIGHATVAGSIALGAKIIEKHFTDDNNREGPDHKFAMNPQTWKSMVEIGNQVYYSLGDGIKKVEENETIAIILQQRCLRAKKKIESGHILIKEDFEVLRPKPVDSFEPFRLNELIGKKLKNSILSGEHFTSKHLM